MIQRSRVVVALLLVSMTAPTRVRASDAAREEYEFGKSAMKAGEAFAALAHLERAVELDPRSERYRKLLEKAKGDAVGRAQSMSKGLGIPQFPQLHQLGLLCRRIAPADPRCQEVAEAEAQTRSGIEGRCKYLSEQARSGSLQRAKALLTDLLPSESLVPDVRAAIEEVAVAEDVANAQAAMERGDLERVFAETGTALRIRAADARAQALRDRAVDASLAKISELERAYAESSSPSELEHAIAERQKALRDCAPCEDKTAESSGLEKRLVVVLRRVLEGFPRNATRAQSWAQCALVDEAESVLPAREMLEMKSFCPPGASKSLRIGLELDSPTECDLASLPTALQSVFPNDSDVVRISGKSPGWPSRDIDLVVRVEVEGCTVSSLGDRNLQKVTSSYVSGTQQLANPDYISLQSDLATAFAEQANYQRQVQADPQNSFATGALIGIAFRIGKIRRLLSNTPPLINQPIQAPYVFERFEAGRRASLLGHLSLLRQGTAEAVAQFPLSQERESWAPGSRGVALQDSQGNREQSPRLPAGESMQAELVAATVTSVVETLKGTLPTVLAGTASNLLSTKQSTDALGYLSVLKSTKIADSDQDLKAYQGAHLESLAATAVAISAQQEFLAPFGERLRVLSAAVSREAPANAPFGASSVEVALQSLVVIRRGSRQGSGFLVSATGDVVTNAHVIEETGSIEVETQDGSQYLGLPVRVLTDVDLALVRITARSMPYLELSSIDNVRIGADVFALGAPEGLQGTVTKGVVSARRNLGGVRFLQIDASINHGNSGGPLITPDGRVVGINSFRLTDSEGLNFAIAIDEAVSRLQIVRH